LGQSLPSPPSTAGTLAKPKLNDFAHVIQEKLVSIFFNGPILLFNGPISISCADDVRATVSKEESEQTNRRIQRTFHILTKSSELRNLEISHSLYDLNVHALYDLDIHALYETQHYSVACSS
jgi:hypothetical protein